MTENENFDIRENILITFPAHTQTNQNELKVLLMGARNDCHRQ